MSLLYPKPQTLPSPTSIPHLDKWIHMFLYWLWTVLVLHGWQERATHTKLIFALAVHAACTEWIQGLMPNRSADIYDFMADMVGVIAAYALMSFLRRHTKT
ncbi:MAG: VanZ family protein [Bacteroidota bacterium]